MVPRASPGRVLGSKTSQNGVQMACPNASFDINVHRFCCAYCILVASSSRHSLAFHRHQMYNIRYLFNVYAYLGQGGKPTVDASQMFPRCLPDVAQMPPRCFPDVSQMPPRWLPDASQMSPRCLPDAS